MAVAIVHVFAVPAQCQAHHGECHDIIYYPKQTHSPEGSFCRDCLFLDAINALTPRSNARMRCSHQGAIGFSRVIWSSLRSSSGCPAHNWPTLFALSMDHRTTNSLDNMASSSLARIRAIVFLFPLPQKVHGVFFREHATVAVLAGDSKRSFWVPCTVMKDCRSLFGWQCAQLKENAIRRVVERQV